MADSGPPVARDHKVPTCEDPTAEVDQAMLPVRLPRRAFLRGAGLAAAGVGIAACSPVSTPAASRSKQKVQLTYQDWPSGWFPAMAQSALEEFHATHPNISVYYVPDPENPNYEDKVSADMQSGTMADVFQGCCTQFPIWAQKGYTLDLRPYVAADIDKDTIADWDPAQYRAFFTRDGRQFGLPKYHGALALYYNKDLFRQAHVDFPNETWTHDDYLQAMQRLTPARDGKDQVDHWGSMLEFIWDRMQVHINAWGGHYVDPNDRRHSLMGEPAALAAFKWLRDAVWEHHVMPTNSEIQKMGTREAFTAGRLAMVEDGSWALKDMLTSARFDMGLAPFPAGPARRATLATTDGFGIYAGTKHPDEAWELVEFLISKSYGRTMAKVAFLQPARASLVDEWASYIKAEFPAQTRELDIAAFAHGHIHGYSVVTEVFANMAEAERIASAGWEHIFTFGDEPVERMVQVSADIERAQRG